MLNLLEKKEVKIVPLKVGIPFSEKLTMVESLSIMLESGIPILEALDSIKEDSTHPTAKRVVAAIADSVQRGSTLAESFSAFPKIFDDIFVNTVKAGEDSGSLDKVLTDITESMKQNEELKSDIRGAMFYPAIVLFFLAIYLVLMFAFVLPRIVAVFNKLNVPKTLPTQILISTTLFVNKYYLILTAAAILSLAIFLFLISKKEIRASVVGVFFKLPLFGSLLKYLDISSFSRTLSLLLSAGIPIIRAVETSTQVVINKKTKEALSQITHKLTEGKTLAESMKDYSSFPTLMTRIVSTGEKTGKLDEVLAEIATHYHMKLRRQVKQLSTLLEPVLIIVVGIIMGLVVIVIISSIYQLIGQVRPR